MREISLEQAKRKTKQALEQAEDFNKLENLRQNKIYLSEFKSI